jgi:hypothetical protein
MKLEKFSRDSISFELTLLPVLMDFVEPLLSVGIKSNVKVALVQTRLLSHWHDDFYSTLMEIL